jgi:hypothetical protein
MVPDFSVVVVGIRSLSTFLQLEMHLETWLYSQTTTRPVIKHTKMLLIDSCCYDSSSSFSWRSRYYIPNEDTDQNDLQIDVPTKKRESNCADRFSSRRIRPSRTHVPFLPFNYWFSRYSTFGGERSMI